MRENVMRVPIATIVSLILLVGGSADGAEKPNIVLILADDLGYGDLKCYGHPYARTPNIDKLARQGTRFTQYYSNGATCCPARTALMTGKFCASFQKYPADHGFGTSVTVTELLGQAGYRTGHFGKWHIGDQPDTRPPARGFDESCGLMYSNDMWDRHPESPQNYANFPLQFWVQAVAHGLRVDEIAVPRIYVDPNRSFGADLDDADRRLALYRQTFERELVRCATLLRARGVGRRHEAPAQRLRQSPDEGRDLVRAPAAYTECETPNATDSYRTFRACRNLPSAKPRARLCRS